MQLFILCLISFLLAGCQTGYYQGPPSDHFNGRYFYNPDQEEQRSFADIFRQARAAKQHPWKKSELVPYTYSNSQKIFSNELKVTFVNHATVLIQTKKLNFLTDPIWSYRASPFSWIGPARIRDPGVEFSKLPPINVVLISHNHYDHLDIPTLQRLDKTFHPIFIVPLGNKVFLEHYNISNVIELDWWQQYKISDAIITFFPAKHWSTRWLFDGNRTLWGSYGIEVGTKKIYFAGDTAYAKHFQMIHSKWGAPDLALLPIGAYEPRSLLKSVHVNPEEAVEAHEDLASHLSIGMHFGTFQLSDEPIDQPLKDLKIARRQALITDKQFFTLREGESYFLR